MTFRLANKGSSFDKQVWRGFFRRKPNELRTRKNNLKLVRVRNKKLILGRWSKQTMIKTVK